MANPGNSDARFLFLAAVAAGDVATVRTALAQGMRAGTASDHDNVTALSLAAHCDGTAMLDLLYRAGAKPNQRLPTNHLAGNRVTALNSALFGARAEAASWLLEHGANPRICDDKGRTAAHYLLREADRIVVDAGAPDFVVDTLRRMLDRGVLVDQPCRSAGWALLHWAVSNLSVPAAAVQLLLDRGADVRARTGAGETPLHLACRHANWAAFELLVQRGASARCAAVNGTTALHVTPDEALVDALLEMGADIEARDRDGHTPLASHLRRCQDGRSAPPTVLRLIGAGADLDSADPEGVTPRDFIRTNRLGAIELAIAAMQARSTMDAVRCGAAPAAAGRA